MVRAQVKSSVLTPAMPRHWLSSVTRPAPCRDCVPAPCRTEVVNKRRKYWRGCLHNNTLTESGRTTVAMICPNPTRSSLLLRLRSTGDRRAWQEFVEIYTPLVFGFVRKRGLQEADAADVAQEVMRAVARAMPDFDYHRDLGGFRAWLFRVTRNKFNDFLEHRRRVPSADGGSGGQRLLETLPCSPSEPDWDADYRRRLFEWATARVRGEVQDATWQAFWRTAMEDQPARLVSCQLGLSPGAVYVARCRVTARLRELVASVAGDDQDKNLIPENPGANETSAFP